MRKIYQVWSYIVAALLISTMLVNVGIAAPQPPEPPAPTIPRVYVEPLAIVDPSIGLGDEITVSIKVTEVSHLYGWGFFLYYRPSVLNLTSLVKGNFVHPTWAFSKANATGYVTAAAYFLPQSPVGISGSGTLATITFKVVSVGITLLDLANTKLNTLINKVSVPIEHTASDGFFDNRPANALLQPRSLQRH